MNDERIDISSICSATNWWLEIRCADTKKLLGRLPIAAWAVTKDTEFKAICYDSNLRRVFCAYVVDDEDGFDYSFKHGINLKQIGDGLPLDYEKPKRSHRKSKK